MIRPFGVDVGPDGTVAVTDTGGHRVELFSAAGAFLAELGAGTIGVGSFDAAFGPGGDLYVSDPANDRILHYSEPAPPAPTPAAPISLPAPPAGAADTAAPALRILGARLRLDRRGRLFARLRCPVTERSGPCRGALRLQPSRKLAGKRPTLARGRFSIAAGKTKRVRLRVTRRGRRLLASRPQARRVRAFTRVSDAAGNSRLVAKAMRVRVPR